jgi:hypothetical protein
MRETADQKMEKLIDMNLAAVALRRAKDALPEGHCHDVRALVERAEKTMDEKRYALRREVMKEYYKEYYDAPITDQR